jgi:hypothetical protein
MPIKLSGKLSPYFTRKAQADMVSTMPKPVTPVKDLLFPAARQRQKTSPYLFIDEIMAQTGAIPVSQRGSRSYPVDGATNAKNLIEVAPINPSIFSTGKDINDIIALGDTESLQAYLLEKEEQLRDVVSNTTELLVRQSLSGKIAYPLFNGTEASGTYEVKLGSIKDAGGTNIANADLAGLQKWLAGLYQKQVATGAAGQVAFMVGENVFNKIVAIVVAAGSTAPVVWTDTGCKLFGKWEILSMPYSYVLPGTNKDVPVIPADAVQTIDLTRPGMLFYAALDDLDSKLAPLPFFVKPVNVDDPSGIKFIAESKPLPATAMSYMTRSVVKTS